MAKPQKAIKVPAVAETKQNPRKRIRKPLTDAQRKRKNRKDRERRRRAREAANQAATALVPVCKDGKPCQSKKTGISCSGCPSTKHECRGCKDSPKSETASKAERVKQVAEHAVELAHLLLAGTPVLALPPGLEGRSFERTVSPGVTRRIICLPGHTIDLTVVDESVATHGLRKELEQQFEMTSHVDREIAAIVDRQKDAE